MIFLRLLPAHSAKLHRTPNSAQLFLAIAVHHKQCAVLLSLSLSFHYSVSIKTFAAVGLYMKTSCSLVASSVVLVLSLVLVSCADALTEKFSSKNDFAANSEVQSEEANSSTGTDSSTEQANSVVLSGSYNASEKAVVLAWQGNSYVESYVYIWLDGAYKAAVRTSAGSATVSVRASGSHTVVLKDGNTSTAAEISKTITVTVPENAS